MFSIVLVCLGVFQEYIMTNIAQLVKLGHTKIYVLTNTHLIPLFEPFAELITLISAESLDDIFNFSERSAHDKEWRDGFWHYTSERFFTLHSFMAKHDVRNVIHIENDVLLYYNCDETLAEPLNNSRRIHIPFDSYTRNIASIVYIPDASTLGQVLEHYDYGKNDMYNFSEIRKKTNLIDQFPIFMEDIQSSEDKGLNALESASALGSAAVNTDALESAAVNTDALESAAVNTDALESASVNTDALESAAVNTDALGSASALERAFVSHGWSRFGGYIFDAAAIGQFIGGVDPRNCPNDSRGFINETCVIKYNNEGTILWKNCDGFLKPFLQTREAHEIPIFNLHIHSKELTLYV